MLVRLEIIANKALEDDIMDELRACECNEFTIIPEVYGRGRQEPKQGDAVWPEINFMIIIYCDDEIANRIRRAIVDVKNAYPLEGLKFFKSDASVF